MTRQQMPQAEQERCLGVFLTLARREDRGRLPEDLRITLDRPRVRRGPRYHEYRDRLLEVLRIALEGASSAPAERPALALVK